MKFLVVKTQDQAQVFEFKSDKEAKEFAKFLQKQDPFAETFIAKPGNVKDRMQKSSKRTGGPGMIKHKSLMKELERYKKEHGTSYKWVADKIGIKENVFRQVLIGNCKIGLRKTILLANLLSIPLYEIWREK